MTPTPDQFTTRTLRALQQGERISGILAAALNAVDPIRLVKHVLRITPDALQVRDLVLPFSELQRIYVISIGKAARPMALAAAEILGERLTRGTILTKTPDKDPAQNRLEKFTTYLGGHPIPNGHSEKAAAGIIEEYSSLNREDLVLVLISGGGSALLSAPADGLSLADLRAANQALLNSGADIREINTVRKHLSLVKGGRLAKILSPASQVTLILSDVMDDPIDMIASGPTVGDETTFNDALMVIKRYSLEDSLPASVLDHIYKGLAGEIPETPKPDDPIFNDHHHWILAGNRQALQAGIQQAASEGFHADEITAEPQEAREAGSYFGSLLSALSSEPGAGSQRPFCLIWGGETTVTLPSGGSVGRGGRNLELALGAVEPLRGAKNVALVALATDGEDGVTDAAGAVVTGRTYQDALERGLDPEDFLRRHDSYTFFHILDDLILTGSTQTNVNDLCFLFAF